jgi:hypothetical protein
VQIKAEYNQLLEMAAAFGVRLLGAALVWVLHISGTKDAVDSLPDHFRRIEVDYQSGSKQSHSKDSVDLCTVFI